MGIGVWLVDIISYLYLGIELEMDMDRMEWNLVL
jgi:hypothetical protein